MFNFKTAKIDQKFIDEIEEELICADLGSSFAFQISEELSTQKLNKNITSDELKDFVGEYLGQKIPLSAQKFSNLHLESLNILMFGANGAGKTTTIAKLAHIVKSKGYSIGIVAADTFRAGAVKQLELWGMQLGIDVYTNPELQDPAAVAYQGINHFADKNVVIIDTSGRMSTNSDLMMQLKKIYNSASKASQQAPLLTTIVIDGTLGVAAKSQYEGFAKYIPIDGVIVTKLDSSARGGFLVPLLMENPKLKVFGIGRGESQEDLEDFYPTLFARNLLK